MKCKICNNDIEYKNFNSLSRHLKNHPDISKQDYYDTYLRKDADEGKCKICGKDCGFINMAIGYHTFCSCKCRAKDPEVKKKYEDSLEKLYGARSVLASEILRQEIKNTKKEKYGNENFNNREKAEKTSIKKYGVKVPIQNKQIELKRDRKNMMLVGTDKFTSLMISKYGVSSPMKSKEISKKSHDTYTNNCIKKFGVSNLMQVKDISNRTRKKYNYNGEFFDSGWELAYYIWLKDRNIIFTYHPKVSFKYFSNGKEYFYFPDFQVGDEFVEIKGDQFFRNSNGTMSNPYDKSEEAQIKAKDKYECMKKNDIKIITDCSEMINYVNNKYGNNFIKSCLVNK